MFVLVGLSAWYVAGGAIGAVGGVYGGHRGYVAVRNRRHAARAIKAWEEGGQEAVLIYSLKHMFEGEEYRVMRASRFAEDVDAACRLKATAASPKSEAAKAAA